jgi:hypothetical protein
MVVSRVTSLACSRKFRQQSHLRWRNRWHALPSAYKLASLRAGGMELPNTGALSVADELGPYEILASIRKVGDH